MGPRWACWDGEGGLEGMGRGEGKIMLRGSDFWRVVRRVRGKEELPRKVDPGGVVDV